MFSGSAQGSRPGRSPGCLLELPGVGERTHTICDAGLNSARAGTSQRRSARHSPQARESESPGGPHGRLGAPTAVSGGVSARREGDSVGFPAPEKELQAVRVGLRFSVKRASAPPGSVSFRRKVTQRVLCCVRISCSLTYTQRVVPVTARQSLRGHPARPLPGQRKPRAAPHMSGTEGLNP